MKDDIKISRKFTVSDWQKLRKELSIDSNENWEDAIGVFEDRVTSRFLNPIAKIVKDDVQIGEGFSIALISVVLLEFLAAFEQGKIYVNKRKNELAPSEYGSTSKLLSDFFSSNELINSGFQNRELRDRFYSHIRCGLVHEARTKGVDVIRSDKHSELHGLFYFKLDYKVVLNRDELYRRLLGFKADYKKSILDNTKINVRRKFLMKMDEICEIQHVWYFAYGSNMNIEQLNKRLKEIDTNYYAVEKVELKNYQFVYNKLSKDKTSKANILFKKEAITYGIAVLMDSEKFKLFGEKFEIGYAACEVELNINRDQNFKGLTFISHNITNVKPSSKYERIILQGAQELGLPENYISEFIRVIA